MLNIGIDHWLLHRNYDSLTHYLGWVFYRDSHFQWPPGANFSYGIEISSSIKAQLIFAATIPVIFQFTKNIKFDRFLGELSYPVYILHWAFWIIIKPFFEANPRYFSVISFGTSVALASAVFGLIIYFLIEKKINNFRESKLFIEANLPAINIFIAQCKWLILGTYFSFPLAILGYIFYHQSK
jgi:hypothetical protein